MLELPFFVNHDRTSLKMLLLLLVIFHIRKH